MNKKFVLCGQSRLTAGVASDLVAAGHRVLVLYQAGDKFDPNVYFRDLGPRFEMRTVIETVPTALERLDLSDVTCILALGTSDDENLHVALTANKVAPHVPVVLRTFDEALAQALEQGTNIRGAFSVSALSAPSFVGAALSEEVLATLILGEDRVLVCQVVVHEAGRLHGRSLAEIEATSRCRVLWSSHDMGMSTQRGTVVVLGGLLDDILILARDNAPPGHHRLKSPVRAVREPRRAGRRRVAALLAGITLFTVLLISTFVFAHALDLSPIDAVYFVITTVTTTGYGDITLRHAPGWVKIFGSVLMIFDMALIAVLYAWLAAWMTTDRIEEHMGRRAARINHHAVIAGLGNVGYRVQRIFHRLGIPTVVLERSEDVRFVEAVRENSVVLQGDASLPESLDAAAITRARYFIAVTDDDMSNIQSTLQARRQNPDIRTVTRIMNPHLAELLPRNFSLDAIINPTVVSSDAFVGAATDQRAPRSFYVAGDRWVALRWTCDHEFTIDERREWGKLGIHIVATEQEDASLIPAPRGVGLPVGTTMVLAGPAEAVEDRLGHRNPALLVEFGDLT